MLVTSKQNYNVWVHSFIEPDLFDDNVLFDNTTPIYLICLLWKLGLGLGL